MWTPWGAGAAISAGIAAISETLQPVAAQAAHAGEAARADALLSAIRDGAGGSAAAGSAPSSAGGARRRRGAAAAEPTEPAAPAAAPTPASTAASNVSEQPVWFRPQDGSRATNMLRAANARGLSVALWSACPYDWDAQPEQVRARIEAQLDAQSAGPADTSRGAAGAVVSLYLTLPSYLEAAKAAHRPAHDVVASASAVLDVLQARGVPCVTLSTLAAPHGARAAPTELFPT